MPSRISHQKRLVRAYLRALTDPSLPGPFRFVSRNFRLSGGVLTGDLDLPQAIAWRQHILLAFPDLQIHTGPAIMLSEKDTVAIRVRWTGTHMGPFRDLPATNRRVDAALFAFFRIRNGLIDRVTQLTDSLALMEQLQGPSLTPSPISNPFPSLGPGAVPGLAELSHPFFVPPESFNGVE